MKLSEYAKKNSITYVTAYRHWQKGYIRGKQLPSGTIVGKYLPDGIEIAYFF